MRPELLVAEKPRRWNVPLGALTYSNAASGLVGLDIECREADLRNVARPARCETVVRSAWLSNNSQEPTLLTDIFAFRYANKNIWDAFSTKERRLLVQAFSVVKDMNPYYDYKGREDPVGKAFWKSLAITAYSPPSQSRQHLARQENSHACRFVDSPPLARPRS